MPRANPLIRPRIFLFSEWAVAVLIFALQGLYYWILPPNFLDEGIWLELTHFVARGLRPYVDFPSVYGPYYLKVLSFFVDLLGGKLMHLRIVLGCLQGFACFAILRWSLRYIVEPTIAFIVCILVAFSIAHPTVDPTMFWGLRYYSALLFIVPLSLAMSAIKPIQNLHRNLLFLSWSALFLYSGEAGVIAAPALFVFLIFLFLARKQNPTALRDIGICVALGLVGMLLNYIILGDQAVLYTRLLLIDAPKTYKDMGFNYPSLSLHSVHFYFPFALLASLLLFVRSKGMRRWGLWAAGAALLPALKVATSRSDEIHLSYAYPFVIFLTFLLYRVIKDSSSRNRRGPTAVATICLGGLALSIVAFFSRYDVQKVRETASAIKGADRRRYNSNWDIWMPVADFDRLKQSTGPVRQSMQNGHQKLFVFPFQQILYSEFGLNPLNIEPIQPCSLKTTRAECSRSFNGTFPNLVVWVPEGSMYSWAMDGYYSSFEYPEAFETLKRDFEAPRLLGESGWYLFEKAPTPKSEPIEYFDFQPSSFESCPQEFISCPSLDANANMMRIPMTTAMTCIRPTEEFRRNFIEAFGVQVRKSIEPELTHLPAWACVDAGTDKCKCSRIRHRREDPEILAKWAWQGFSDADMTSPERLVIFETKIDK